MKKMVSSLVIAVALVFVSTSSAFAGADSPSGTTYNKVNNKVDTYVKNTDNKKSKTVTVSLEKDGKVIETQKLKIKPNKQVKVKFETKDAGSYKIKSTVNKKSSKTSSFGK